MKNTLLNITFGPGNRKKTLRSILNFYDQFSDDELPFIIITDQSIDTWDNLEHRVIKAFHHYPVNKYSMYEMWIDLAKKYPHEYFCWNNDDDFTVPESLVIAETFMNANPDYTMCQGQVAATVSNTRSLKEYAKSTWFQADCDNPDPYIRIKNMFTNLHANPHAVFRKDTFVNACNLCIESNTQKNNFGPLRFWDKILCYVSSVDGYRKTDLDCLMSIRSDRTITKQVAHIANEYHQILEKNTPYIDIYHRLKPADNAVKKYFENKTGKNIEYDYLVNIFNESNMGFTNSYNVDLLPHTKEKWYTYIDLAEQCWKHIT